MVINFIGKNHVKGMKWGSGCNVKSDGSHKFN